MSRQNLLIALTPALFAFVGGCAQHEVGAALETEARLPSVGYAATVPLHTFLWASSDFEMGVASVEITPNALRLAGDEILGLTDGVFASGDLEDGQVSSLYDVLQAGAERSMGLGHFGGELLLVVDVDVPFETVQAVMDTAANAQFDAFYFLVDDADAAPLDLAGLDASNAREILVTEERMAWADNMPAPVWSQVHQDDGVVRCADYAVDPSTVCTDVAYTMDALSEEGAVNVLLSSTEAGDAGVGNAEFLADSRSFNIGDRVTVFLSELPATMAPGPRAIGECGQLR